MLSAKLQIRQSQALVMTPQLMQSIRLLQLNHLELSAFVEREIERNPLLELASDSEAMADPAREPPGIDTPPDTGRSTATEADTGSADTADWLDGSFETSTSAMETSLGTSLENVFDADAPPAPREAALAVPSAGDPWKSTRFAASLNQDGNPLEAFAAADRTLGDHLRDQLATGFSGPLDRFIAEEIVGSIDEDGYLRRPLEDIASRLGTSLVAVEDILARIQRFDPPGIAARDLAECMRLQLVERDRFDPAMQALVGNLELLARRDFPALMRLCGVDRDDLADMVGEIRRLDPRPGARFATEPVQTVVPDVVVSPRADGGWSVELNPETLPRVLVDRHYHAEVAQFCRREEDRAFITDCLQNANWLEKSLDQRPQTILKVATEIVKQQDMFLAFGVEHLKPLNLRTVADAISMHESTVSRVTSNKYMLTGRGLFEMKYFFTAAIAATGGSDAHSAEAVRHRIRQLIDAEQADRVLSDDAIVDILRGAGIDIARRTVAKYRESMHIPSSVQRRREKRAFPVQQAS
ncbi:MAG: RNA polymerase factor sigma-54 [Pseudomonadota bacterium]|nr:RNA polymerase factor sigma-54 [Pseudomonadota bacterium]